jgi:Ni,Fe-hydrogenase III large subunit/Ni,Fe-hydrogenase III component G
MTTVADARRALITDLYGPCIPLSSSVDDQIHVQVRPGRLSEVTSLLKGAGYHLVTTAANDERALEDRRFKIYYVFSHDTLDLFVIVEYLLAHDTATYESIYADFPAVDPFEREMRDMLGLGPDAHDPRSSKVRPGSWLHGAYPPDLAPLRRDWDPEVLARVIAEHVPQAAESGPDEAGDDEPALTISVGPIHAGIIESGNFLITMEGEVIARLDIRLGYKHRGIERMFQSEVSLLEGWRLAEQVSGDSSFAHSLAYCRAVESLTDTRVPDEAEMLRVVLLELERIHNHVGDVAALAEDVGLELFASEFAAVRETLLRLNKRLAGHRYLRSLNRPGGLELPDVLRPSTVAHLLAEPVAQFGRLADAMKSRAGFRERTKEVGIVTAEEIRRLGATGLTARASGVDRDSRLHHPIGPTLEPSILVPAPPPVRDAESQPNSEADESSEARGGDVYARFIARVHDVMAAHELISCMSFLWPSRVAPSDLFSRPRVLPENNFISALGYAEGFRGEVVYWLMQDKMGGIYRCKVRDPSIVNWPALKTSVTPREIEVRGRKRWVETMVADFPLINKSFNLSYAGNDL